MWELLECKVWASKRRNESFSERSNSVQDKKGAHWQEAAREQGSDENEGTVFSGSGNERNLFGDGKYFLDEDEWWLVFFLIADYYERPSDYRYVPYNEKAILKYCSRENFELTPFISDPRRTLKQSSEEMEETVIPRAEWAVFAPPIHFLECKFYTWYTLLFVCSDQELQ